MLPFGIVRGRAPGAPTFPRRAELFAEAAGYHAASCGVRPHWHVMQPFDRAGVAFARGRAAAARDAPQRLRVAPVMAVQQHLGFFDRREAGALLATKLYRFHGTANVVVLAVSRGGAPVAYEIARSLHAPLDVRLASRLPTPGHPEILMGAIAGAGVQVLDDRVMGMCRPDPVVMTALIGREAEELARRERACRGGRAVVPIQGRFALLVDDGIVTGATMRAAAIGARRLKPARLFIVAPVGSRAACRELHDVADDVICPYQPELFSSASEWFARFEEPSDDDVRRLLADHATRNGHRLSA